ncbi:sodium/bile acid cotransporter 7-B-like [Bacillus rossius redtenbacheri]|uniref:sodium/bile acid cotransporter 7-B-like n=1 Tax=Bacillus rossius redtenbacheri TaxID=93214 RepID=UPI002FDDD04C
MKEWLQRCWVIPALLLMNLVTMFLPQPSQTMLEHVSTADYWSAAAVAFLCGLCVARQPFQQALLDPEVHVLCALYSLVIAPLSAVVAALLLRAAGLSEAEFLRGLVLTACLPPSLTSTVALTTVAAGSEATAVVGALGCKYISVLVSPLLMRHLAELDLTWLSATETLKSITLSITVPLVAGQIIRAITNLEYRQVPLRHLCCAILLLNQYVVSSNLATDCIQAYSQSRLAIMVLLVLTVLLIQDMIIFQSSKTSHINLTSEEIASVLFTGAHKSLRYGRLMLDGKNTSLCCFYIYTAFQTMVCFGVDYFMG